MSRIVVNESLKLLKKANDFEFTELAEGEYSIPSEEPDIDRIPSSVIHQLIRELPDGYRTIFNLYVIEERSHNEIAKMLNIKVSTSASQLHRAKAMLASRIKKIQSSFESAII